MCEVTPYMVSAATKRGISVIYHTAVLLISTTGVVYNLCMLPPILINAFLSTDSSAIIPLMHLLFPLKWGVKVVYISL